MLEPDRRYSLSELLAISDLQAKELRCASNLPRGERIQRLKLWTDLRKTLLVMKTWSAVDKLDGDSDDNLSPSARA
jgi:hypothetical protein